MPIADGDMDLISAPNAVYGFNYYNPTTVRASEGPAPFEMVPTPGAPLTGFGSLWPIRPDTMRDFLMDIAQRYGSALPPIIFTENGASFPEPDTTETEIRDSERIDYLRDHLGAVIEAKAAGVRIDGYTVSPSPHRGGPAVRAPVSVGRMVWFTLAWLAIWTVQLAPIQLLLPLQLDTQCGHWIDGVVWSRLVFCAGGLAGIIAVPMAGRFSDRPRSRFGRRRT
ncbi:family 1 glycosylhydrolase [Brevibacterium siliguriense]|uniref:family 1 glycosylhydrolase n=1 Tax=Brevibacterium siliguriense TaxID=1136497 RepID=UPI000A750CA3|nr:family 1 glycosylhydrolase [Brevibacterium siliguriense]